MITGSHASSLVALLLSAVLAAGCAGTGVGTGGSAGPGRGISRRTTKTDRECAKVPACVAYLENIKRRVNELWKPEQPLTQGRVVVRMRIDSSGTPTTIDTVRADSSDLARSCRTAIGYAEPFGLLPVSLAFLKGQDITIEFVYGKPEPRS